MIVAGEPVVPAAGRRSWAVPAYLYGLATAGVLGYFLLGLPVQVSDSFGNLLQVQQASLREILVDQLWSRAYLRPLLWAQIKVVYELAGGNYWAWFRGIHVIQVAVLIVLCIRLMRPRDARDFTLVPLALAVLVGAHTFTPTIREAFPINSFMTVMVCCAAAANIALENRSRWWTDTLALLLFAFAALTVESGLLVWVVCAIGVLLGARGLSRGAMVAMTACLVAYLAGRLLWLDVGAPALAERASGFGFRALEPQELAARFGDFPWGFYAYNVVSSIATVLFAEPKGGIWRFVFELSAGSVHPWTAVSVATSTMATALVGRYLWTARARLRTRSLDHDDRLVLLFAGVLVANAVISYPYTKSIIMSPAGMFLAVATFVAARAWLRDADGAGVARQALAVAALVALSSGWAGRDLGVHYALRYTAQAERNQWAMVDDWLARQQMAIVSSQAVALRDALRRDALSTHPAPPPLSGGWSRWVDIDW
jgi:hypothetical protein